MSYRQQEENEEAKAHLETVQEMFDSGALDEPYSDWLMHEHIYPPITSRYELFKHMAAGTRSEDFIDEFAFGKQKLNS